MAHRRIKAQKDGNRISKCTHVQNKTNWLPMRQWLAKNPNADRRTSQLVLAGLGFKSCANAPVGLGFKACQNAPKQQSSAEFMNSQCNEHTDFILFTDGACDKNPGGVGGWSYILRNMATGEERCDSGGVASTTNNRMEMTAVINGLSSLKGGESVRIVSDSMYVLDGMRSWMHAWAKRGWVRRGEGEIKNLELWKLLYSLVSRHRAVYQWVRGHSGHKENERCDTMATNAILKIRNRRSVH